MQHLTYLPVLLHRDGNLEWDGDNFYQTSQNLELKGSELFAEVQTADGNWRYTSINLADRIGLDLFHGNLVYQ
jgi:hypothetical protein